MAALVALPRALTIVDAAGMAAHIIIDNKIAYNSFWIWNEIAKLINDKEVGFDWVPSHGKKEYRQPHDGDDATIWRELSDAADKVASQAAKDFLKDSMEPLHRRRTKDALWSRTMLERQGQALGKLRERYPISPEEERDGIHWLKESWVRRRINDLEGCQEEQQQHTQQQQSTAAAATAAAASVSDEANPRTLHGCHTCDPRTTDITRGPSAARHGKSCLFVSTVCRGCSVALGSPPQNCDGPYFFSYPFLVSISRSLLFHGKLRKRCSGPRWVTLQVERLVAL